MDEWIGLFIMASALGMDAFSVSLGMGMAGLGLLQIFRIGIIVGVFHLFMPLSGIFVGRFLSTHFDVIATYIGGGLLLIIGLHMVISSLFNKGQALKPIGWGIILFSFSISIDSFSVGLSLGMLGAKTAVTVGMISAVSMMLAWMGLLLGAKFHRFIGSYGELLGGCVLIGFGFEFFFPVV